MKYTVERAWLKDTLCANLKGFLILFAPIFFFLSDTQEVSQLILNIYIVHIYRCIKYI